MPVYILRLPGSEFTGCMAGIEFFKGKGSTSSLGDAHALAQAKNCGVAVLEADGTEKPIVVKKAAREHLAPVFTADPVASASAPTPTTDTIATQAGGVSAEAPPASTSIAAERAALDAKERNPDDPAEKALMEKAKAKKGGRRKR